MYICINIIYMYIYNMNVGKSISPSAREGEKVDNMKALLGNMKDLSMDLMVRKSMYVCMHLCMRMYI
jgi:hypothetical protein